MPPRCSSHCLSAGLGPLASLSPQPLLVVHVEADCLAEELTHGAVFLLYELPYLLVHLGGEREGDGLSVSGHDVLPVVILGHTLILNESGDVVNIVRDNPPIRLTTYTKKN